MRVTEYNASPERRTLIGLIVCDALLGRTAAQWGEDGLFASRAANIIGNLCVQYFNRYGRAPGKDIESLAASWAVGKDEDTSGEIDDFLRSLDSWDKLTRGINADLLIDEAGQHFSSVRLQRLFEQGQGLLLKGDIAKAQALWDGYKPLEMGQGSYVNPLTDDEALKRVHREKRESIIKYPGGLGEFFGYSLERESLVAILAGEKVGKSWVLLDMACTAVEQGRKVAMFECGDLTERQVMYRLLTRICDRPLKLKDDKPVVYRVPRRLAVEGNTVTLKQEVLEVTKDLSEEKIRRKRDEWRSKCKATDLWRLSVHSTSSLSVPMMRSILDRWQKQDGYTPDVVIIDYADILAPPTRGATDSRDQINATWKALSKMRQDLRCLVVTATQANADAYDSELLNRRNFSEDKRKHAHVTAMFALNRTDSEKKKGIYRLNWLDRRDEAYSEREQCFVAGCLEIARPFMLSSFNGVEG